MTTSTLTRPAAADARSLRGAHDDAPTRQAPVLRRLAEVRGEARPCPDDRPSVVPVAAAQGTLPLDVAGAPGDVRPLAPPPATRTPHDALERWSARFAQALVEVVVGHRPPTQLLRAMTPTTYADVSRRATLVTQQGYRSRPARAQVPQVRSVHVSRVAGLAGTPGTAGAAHTGRPGPDEQPAALPVEAAELSVRVSHGLRSRAIAARVELRQGRWQCTAVEFG